jgi:hypothetical protein
MRIMHNGRVLHRGVGERAREPRARLKSRRNSASFPPSAGAGAKIGRGLAASPGRRREMVIRDPICLNLIAAPVL